MKSNSTPKQQHVNLTTQFHNSTTVNLIVIANFAL